MFEMFALGMAQIASPKAIRPERRDGLPQRVQLVEMAPLQVRNLNQVLLVVRSHAWKALDQVKHHGK
jgi:hypothetical protein